MSIEKIAQACTLIDAHDDAEGSSERLDAARKLLQEILNEADRGNIYDYFHHHLGVAPADETLRELPVNSGCGDECKKAIDAAKTWIDCWQLAFGSSTPVCPDFVENTFTIVQTYWRG